MNEVQWNQEIEQMKSRDLIKIRRLNTGNVSSKGSKEIHTSFYFDKTLQGSRRVESKRGRVFAIGIMIWKCLLKVLSLVYL